MMIHQLALLSFMFWPKAESVGVTESESKSIIAIRQVLDVSSEMDMPTMIAAGKLARRLLIPRNVPWDPHAVEKDVAVINEWLLRYYHMVYAQSRWTRSIIEKYSYVYHGVADKMKQNADEWISILNNGSLSASEQDEQLKKLTLVMRNQDKSITIEQLSLVDDNEAHLYYTIDEKKAKENMGAAQTHRKKRSCFLFVCFGPTIVLLNRADTRAQRKTESDILRINHKTDELRKEMLKKAEEQKFRDSKVINMVTSVRKDVDEFQNNMTTQMTAMREQDEVNRKEVNAKLALMEFNRKGDLNTLLSTMATNQKETINLLSMMNASVVNAIVKGNQELKELLIKNHEEIVNTLGDIQKANEQNHNEVLAKLNQIINYAKIAAFKTDQTPLIDQYNNLYSAEKAFFSYLHHLANGNTSGNVDKEREIFKVQCIGDKRPTMMVDFVRTNILAPIKAEVTIGIKEELYADWIQQVHRSAKLAVILAGACRSEETEQDSMVHMETEGKPVFGDDIIFKARKSLPMLHYGQWWVASKDVLNSTLTANDEAQIRRTFGQHNRTITWSVSRTGARVRYNESDRYNVRHSHNNVIPTLQELITLLVTKYEKPASYPTSVFMCCNAFTFVCIWHEELKFCPDVSVWLQETDKASQWLRTVWWSKEATNLTSSFDGNANFDNFVIDINTRMGFYFDHFGEYEKAFNNDARHWLPKPKDLDYVGNGLTNNWTPQYVNWFVFTSSASEQPWWTREVTNKEVQLSYDYSVGCPAWENGKNADGLTLEYYTETDKGTCCMLCLAYEACRTAVFSEIKTCELNTGLPTISSPANMEAITFPVPASAKTDCILSSWNSWYDIGEPDRGWIEQERTREVILEAANGGAECGTVRRLTQWEDFGDY